jgi:hypothetical protein
MAEEFRTARDTMGEMRLPMDALWGASTQRAVENFPVSGQPVPVEVVHAHAMLKWAAAIANQDNGVVDAEVAEAIKQAADCSARICPPTRSTRMITSTPRSRPTTRSRPLYTSPSPGWPSPS